MGQVPLLPPSWAPLRMKKEYLNSISRAIWLLIQVALRYLKKIIDTLSQCCAALSLHSSEINRIILDEIYHIFWKTKTHAFFYHLMLLFFILTNALANVYIDQDIR